MATDPTATYNPFPDIGSQIPLGLAFVIGALPPSPAMDDIVDAVYGYVQPLYFPAGVSAQVEIELKSVGYTAVNNYINNLVRSGLTLYNANQMPFLGLMLGITSNIPVSSIPDRILDTEQNIADSDLAIGEQNPLFVSTTIGSNAFNYWSQQVALGGGSLWGTYFSGNTAIDTANLPYWVEAAMNGALSSYSATLKGLVEPSTDIVSINLISALFGALCCTTAKVVLNITPKITKRLTLNAQTVSLLGQSGLIGAGSGGQLICVTQEAEGCYTSTQGPCQNFTQDCATCNCTKQQSVCIGCSPVPCQTLQGYGCTNNGVLCNTQAQSCNGTCAVICPSHLVINCQKTGGAPASCPCIQASPAPVCFQQSPLPSCNAANCSC